jgi:Flp pilus assembly protein TadG
MNSTHTFQAQSARRRARHRTRASYRRVRALHPARRSRRNPEAGAALVEFALILPLFLLMVFLVFDFGRAINYWIDTTHLASEGARLAAVNAAAGGDLKTYIRDQADTKELREGGSRSISQPLKVCVDFPVDPDDGTSRKVGDPVRVTVSTNYTWLPMIDAPVTSSEIKGSATHRLEREPDPSDGGCTS